MEAWAGGDPVEQEWAEAAAEAVEEDVEADKVREEVEDDRKRLYTNTDKLHYLREKSELLDELLSRFKLETDF